MMWPRKTARLATVAGRLLTTPAAFLYSCFGSVFASQTRAVRSSLMVTTHLLSRVKTALVTSRSCPSKMVGELSDLSVQSCGDFGSHRYARFLLVVVTMNLPSGLKMALS